MKRYIHMNGGRTCRPSAGAVTGDGSGGGEGSGSLSDGLSIHKAAHRLRFNSPSGTLARPAINLATIGNRFLIKIETPPTKEGKCEKANMRSSGRFIDIFTKLFVLTDRVVLFDYFCKRLSRQAVDWLTRRFCMLSPIQGLAERRGDGKKLPGRLPALPPKMQNRPCGPVCVHGSETLEKRSRSTVKLTAVKRRA